MVAKKSVETTKEPESQKHNLLYHDRNKQQKYLIIEDAHYNKFKQAETHYQVSKKWIEDTWIHIWNKAIKSYLMYPGDRQQYLKEWQSNVHIGAIREKIDVYISFLEDLPMQYIVDGMDADAYKVAREGDLLNRSCLDFVKNDINYISNITDFPIQAGIGLIE